MTRARPPEAPAAPAASAGPREGYRQFALYTVIGGSGVLLDLALFAVLFNVAGLDEQAANLLGTSAGITNNFVWNSLFTFRRTDRPLVRFARFYLVGLSGLALTAALLWLLSDVLGIDANLVKLVSLPLVLALQFWLNKKWSFR